MKFFTPCYFPVSLTNGRFKFIGGSSFSMLFAKTAGNSPKLRHFSYRSRFHTSYAGTSDGSYVCDGFKISG